MKFLVLGCGSIGRRHIKNLKSIGERDLIAVDKNRRSLENIRREFNIEVSDNFSDALKEADAVLICTPNHLHTDFAVEALKAGKHVFIEKPIAHNLKNLDKIEKLSKKLVVQIGYNLLFHPIILKTKEILGEMGKVYFAKIEYGSYFPNWRPTDYRKNYGAKKKQGGGIILEDIHEINYAVLFFGRIDRVFCSAGKISNLQINTEDNAEILLKAKKGFNVDIHMDYLQKKPVRRYKIVCEKGVVVADINEKFIILEKDSKVQKINFPFDYNNTYINELKEFISCIEKKRSLKTGLRVEDGIYDLKIALAAKKSSQKKKEMMI